MSDHVSDGPVTQEPRRDEGTDAVLEKIARMRDVLVLAMIVREEDLAEELASVGRVSGGDVLLAHEAHGAMRLVRFFLEKFLLHLLVGLHRRCFGVRPHGFEIGGASKAEGNLAVEGVDGCEGEVGSVDAPDLLGFGAEIAPGFCGAVEGLGGDVRELDDVAGRD